ncbi:MAG: SDR family oxidoreductase [Flavobacteriales bacterium]|nr:SDR family oxidoreductase [Flavobacteriales bacterium]
MDDRLKGKSALVTGAGPGIGHAICLALAQAGATVTAVARNRENLERLAGAMPSGAHRCWSIDLETDAGCALLAERLREGEVPVIVVNNLHVPSPKTRLRNLSAEAFSSGFTANIDHLFFILEPVLAAQHAQGYGRWIGISSMAARAGMPGQGRYNAQKAAMEALLTTLAVEEGHHGVTANCVALGYMETPSVVARVPEAVRTKLAAANALGRGGTAAQVADAVLFLSSPGSAYITGQVLAVDGGASLAWNFK